MAKPHGYFRRHGRPDMDNRRDTLTNGEGRTGKHPQIEIERSGNDEAEATAQVVAVAKAIEDEPRGLDV